MPILNTDLISPEQAIEATVASHNSKSAIENIEGMSSNGVEIDDSVNKLKNGNITLTKIGDSSKYIGSKKALSVTGTAEHIRTETEIAFNRPIAWAYKMYISPAAIPSQTTDFHGMDIYGTVSDLANHLDLSNTSNYLFESKASYSGSGVLGGNVGGFLEANNYGDGTVKENKALRIYSRNFGNGHIENLYGISIDPVVNNGTIDTAYGIKIGNISGATNNYALWSDGGKVRFAGDIANTGAIANIGNITNTGSLTNTGTFQNIGSFIGQITMAYDSGGLNKIKQQVGANPWYGEFTPFSGEGGMIFNVAYAGNGATIFFRIDGSTKMIVKENGNVGIGTTSPLEKLHVSGKIKATSINFSGLPNSASGLTTGDVWNDNGTLKIV
jgi:hypothetical protein